jgi:uncharacterized protein YjbI with pentapeptide repeats
LTNANFSGASIQGATFWGGTNLHVAYGQIASTASYQEKNLSGIEFLYEDLTGWDFSGQNLTNAIFGYSVLTDVNFTDANLTGALFYGPSGYWPTTPWDAPTGANFTGAIITGATIPGITFSQLASTQNYRQNDLAGMELGQAELSNGNFANMNLAKTNFWGSDLSNTDFTNANLACASFSLATLTGANFTGADITGANFAANGGNFAPYGISFAQLASTKNYQQGNLAGIVLESNYMSGWNLSNQNLFGASFYSATATNANFSGANLGNTIFSFVDFTGANLTNANLSAAFLINVTFQAASLNGANFSDADLRGATGWSVLGTITHNTILPDGTLPNLALGPGEVLPVRFGPVAITVTDSATFDPKSVLAFLPGDSNYGAFGGSGRTLTIVFAPGVIPELGGTLDLTFSEDPFNSFGRYDGPINFVGDTLQLFDWGSPLPAGDRFDSVISDPGLVWDLSQLYTTGQVTLVAIPEPAESTVLLMLVATFVSRRGSR